MEENDYSVYLVTDTKLNHNSRKLIQTIQDAISGGVRIVQLREKYMEDEEFIKLANEVHQVTKQYNVPLIINDRLHVALAIDAEGVHVGQDDKPASEARRLIGPNKILGVSVETVEQAHKAVKDGADYIGIQTCFPTLTKTTPLIVQGHIGIRTILESISPQVNIRAIAIGGLNEQNVHRIVVKSKGNNGRHLDGVACVSGIVGSTDAKKAASGIRNEFRKAVATISTKSISVDEVLKNIPDMLSKLKRDSPLIFHITNYVSINDCANVTLAFGASPIMAFAEDEVEDLVRTAGSVILNIGTLSDSFVKVALKAGHHANVLHKPVVFDPVGAGASELRRAATKSILNTIHVDIIKGNAGEIAAIADITGYEYGKNGDEVQSKGVDSVGKGFHNPAQIVQEIAKREKCVVAMTGEIDIISDGERTVILENGHSLQGKITGSGCMVASAISSFAAVTPFDYFAATVAGIACMNICGEHAANRPDVKGPGTFRAAFIDEMANLDEREISKAINATIVL